MPKRLAHANILDRLRKTRFPAPSSPAPLLVRLRQTAHNNLHTQHAQDTELAATSAAAELSKAQEVARALGKAQKHAQTAIDNLRTHPASDAASAAAELGKAQERGRQALADKALAHQSEINKIKSAADNQVKDEVKELVSNLKSLCFDTRRYQIASDKEVAEL